MIVGAGPMGLELAVAFKRAGIDYVQVEAAQIGQTMYGWPPMTRWFSSSQRIEIAGVPIQSVSQSKCTREEYLAYLRSVVMQFDLAVRTYEPVVELARGREGFVIKTRTMTGETREYAASSVVLATEAWPGLTPWRSRARSSPT